MRCAVASVLIGATLCATVAIFWGINGGNWNRGQAVMGVVADNVRAVDVHLGARHVRTGVRHNAFVVPFRTATTSNGSLVRVAPILR